MESNKFKATVIGAGPGGITTVANLIQYGMTPILWIDPEFKVGKISSYYNIPGNTRTRYFLDWYNHLPVVKDNVKSFPSYFAHYSEDDTQPLLFIFNALNDTTQYLLKRKDVQKLKSTVTKIERKNAIYTINDTYQSELVFLCTGSHPTGLSIHKPEQQVLDLITVLNGGYTDIEKDDRFAVFGSSHSSMLAVMILSKHTKNITLFYKVPCIFAVHYDDWIYHDDSGLKGEVAEWTNKNIGLLHKVQVDEPRFQEEFKKCTKVVYGTGMAKNKLPEIIIDSKIINTDKINYDLSTGRIFEKFYGFGIAFPKEVTDRLGNKEFSVGIWKFMKHVNLVVKGLSSLATVSLEEQNGMQSIMPKPKL